MRKFNGHMIIIAQIYAGNEAEDIVQNVLLKLYDKREYLKTIKNFENWLFYVVKNYCMDFLRKNKKQEIISLEIKQDYIDSLIYEDDIIQMILEKQSYEYLHEKIISLGEIYYLPIIMHYFKNLTLNETAKILGLSVSTLKWRLHTGRQLLKSLLVRGDYNL